MALYASGVTIPADLSGSIAGVGSPGYNASNNIASNYVAAKKRFGGDASVRGMNAGAATGAGSYTGGRLATTQGLDTGNLESALGGGVGSTAYQDALSQRDFQQQSQLANQIGSLNGMNTLEQVLGGVGAVGGTAAKIYGAYGSNRPSSSSPNPDYATMPGSGDLSLWGEGGYDPYSGYDMDQMAGYKLQPNMLNGGSY